MAKRETATGVRGREGMSAAELIARTMITAFEPDSKLVYFGSRLTEAIEPLIRKLEAEAVRNAACCFPESEERRGRLFNYADSLERGE